MASLAILVKTEDFKRTSPCFSLSGNAVLVFCHARHLRFSGRVQRYRSQTVVASIALRGNRNEEAMAMGSVSRRVFDTPFPDCLIIAGDQILCKAPALTSILWNILTRSWQPWFENLTLRFLVSTNSCCNKRDCVISFMVASHHSPRAFLAQRSGSDPAHQLQPGTKPDLVQSLPIIFFFHCDRRPHLFEFQPFQSLTLDYGSKVFFLVR